MQFPLPQSVLGKSNLFYSTMKDHEKICLIIEDTDKEEWYACDHL